MHGPPEGIDLQALFSAPFWDERYGSTDRVWSGNPNASFVESVEHLPPGTALEVGCGEGADAIWLARRGWQVTATDVSTVALERAAAHAGELPIRWEHRDARTWQPPRERFDLVSAQFVHLAAADQRALHRRLAGAVRPGGTLLVIGHHPSDRDTTAGRWDLPDLMFGADQVVAELDPAQWQVDIAAAPARAAHDPHGRLITVHDTVVRAIRRVDASGS